MSKLLFYRKDRGLDPVGDLPGSSTSGEIGPTTSDVPGDPELLRGTQDANTPF